MTISEMSQHALQRLKEGNLVQAEELYRKILSLRPDDVNALHFLGVLCHRQQRYDEAESCIRKALLIRPDYMDAHNNLGILLQEMRRYDEAISSYEKALHLKPDADQVLFNLGTLYAVTKKTRQAIDYFHRTLQLNPNFMQAYIRLGGLFLEIGQGDLSVKCYSRALQMNHNQTEHAEIMNAIAIALDTQYKLDEAEPYLAAATSVHPPFWPAHHNRLMLMCYLTKYSMEEIFAAHRRCATLMEKDSPQSVHANDRMTERRLRVGYVSPDLRKHSVTYFFEPVLASHNKDAFEIYCYSILPDVDETTHRLKRHADHWREMWRLTDGQAVDCILNDRIDILVDLAGHTGNNRLRVFAQKPAPVQVTWLGYPATTGLTTMDYRIVDALTDPVGETERYYSERLIRLPRTFLCYLPDMESPEISDPPALSTGRVTFGSFNKLSKISPEMISLWAIILKELPGSRLIMKAMGLSDKTTRSRIAGLFAGQGVGLDRLILMPWTSSTGDHLNAYRQIDIALDTYPYNGTTTTCESMWMGVPVITLAGNAYGGRVGASILTNTGLPHLIAKTPEDYRWIALNLASNIDSLRTLRERLRQMMQESPLMDYSQFTGNLEAAYWAMWRTWCEKNP